MRDKSDSFNAWLQQASYGDEFFYYTGPTPEVSSPTGFSAPYEAHRAGLVALVQRKGRVIRDTEKYGSVHEYDYIAQRLA